MPLRKIFYDQPIGKSVLSVKVLCQKNKFRWISDNINIEKYEERFSNSIKNNESIFILLHPAQFDESKIWIKPSNIKL